MGDEVSWPHDAATLDAEQRRIAASAPVPWHLPDGSVLVGGVFLAFARGQAGPGNAGDRGWAGATVVQMPEACVLADIVVPAVAGARYDAGRLALRAGSALADAVTGLAIRPDVVLVDATGRDHPRGAGLALHLGAVVDVPTVGVTHRPLLARGVWPPEVAGASTPLTLHGDIVGAWLRTRSNARPVAVHAAWRTDATTAVEIVRRCVVRARTPEPLRAAREVARVARARVEGRAR
jgi:deoxyribonuclease V